MEVKEELQKEERRNKPPRRPKRSKKPTRAGSSGDRPPPPPPPADPASSSEEESEEEEAEGDPILFQEGPGVIQARGSCLRPRTCLNTASKGWTQSRYVCDGQCCWPACGAFWNSGATAYATRAIPQVPPGPPGWVVATRPLRRLDKEKQRPDKDSLWTGEISDMQAGPRQRLWSRTIFPRCASHITPCLLSRGETLLRLCLSENPLVGMTIPVYYTISEKVVLLKDQLHVRQAVVPVCSDTHIGLGHKNPHV